jgi:DNA-binding transcriptional ArsR family regulator
MQLAFNADQIFAALADGTRRDIVLRALSGNEGVAELAGHYPMSFAAVQKHVAVLERAGLVTKERTGRRKVVRTNMDGSAWRGACSTSTSGGRSHRPHDRAMISSEEAPHDSHRRPKDPRP